MNLILNPELPQRNIASAVVTRSLGPGMPALALLVLCCCLPGYSQTASQEQPATASKQTRALGSLSTAGEVYVNDSPAVSESTIFAGDEVHTGATGVATFAISGRGALKVFPQSQVVFSGSNQFTADLEAGTIVLSSVAGGSGMVLRMGDFVLVPSFPREQSISSKVERAPDGSFTVTCFDGSVGVLTLTDRSGEFLHSGQSLHVSSNTLPSGEVAPVFSSRGAAKPALERMSPQRFMVGAAGAAGVAFLIDRLIQSRGSPAVSPSAP